MKGKDIINVLNKYYPEHISYDWDNTGMQVGCKEDDVLGILLCLDVTKEVIEEAKEMNCNWILSHHPLIFAPIKSVQFNNNTGALIQTLIKDNINLYSIHTNFDLSVYGMNYALASHINLKNITQMKEDINGFSAGVIGDLEKKMSIDELATYLKDIFKLESVSFVGKKGQMCKKIALVGGSGTSAMYAALNSGAECFITGDVTHHKALDALALGLGMIDISHGAEFIGFKHLKDILEKENIDIPIYFSYSNVFPIKKK